MYKNKRGQIWVETLIYTLIAFVMIGIVLFFAGPKITAAQDKAVLDQTVKVMENINSIIETIGIPGNKRVAELTIKKGEIKIDSLNDLITFEMQSKHEYSETGQEISYGGITALTEQEGDEYRVLLTSNYSQSYNISFNGQEELKTLTKSPSPYSLIINNKGGEPTNIDFSLN